ncbi:hypothetical protein QR680_001335 [Steinernema hermaphroditum]|uniref:Uncharacterized protein n=1 Tax=Steinernema hermaphroditum TaxID=289476 RepID=A0AA39LFT4_9BILA|nr:hypothetical protein QR680_001335 [Steinernema hermaphroditum]
MDSCRSLFFVVLAIFLCAMCVRAQSGANDYYGFEESGDVRSSFPPMARHRLRLSLFDRPEVMLRKRVSEQEINSLLRNTWLG